jgi:3-phenylpropionate/trans-cinnamate dioxygenase ferredoxin subunit
MAKHVVATADELPPNSRKLVTVKGRAIAIFNVEGELFALTNRCPHRGGSLCDGKLTGLVESDEPGHYSYSRAGEILRCPWHGWEFDIRTGKSWCAPDQVRTRSYNVAIESGEAVVEGPYELEKFPISIEQDYVVLIMPDAGR